MNFKYSDADYYKLKQNWKVCACAFIEEGSFFKNWNFSVSFLSNFKYFWSI